MHKPALDFVPIDLIGGFQCCAQADAVRMLMLFVNAANMRQLTKFESPGKNCHSDASDEDARQPSSVGRKLRAEGGDNFRCTGRSSRGDCAPALEGSATLNYRCFMTANSVIEEIKQLTRDEQSRVIRFAFELARERQLSGDKLSGLAQRMADAEDPIEAQKLREEIHRGFYGE
jgi:hypothetical protein